MEKHKGKSIIYYLSRFSERRLPLCLKGSSMLLVFAYY